MRAGRAVRMCGESYMHMRMCMCMYRTITIQMQIATVIGVRTLWPLPEAENCLPTVVSIPYNI